jgi:hypothetical protein
MLGVVVADIEVQGEYQFEQRQFGSNPEHLQLLAEWQIEREVAEVVMESTAQYWKPVWGALERYWKPGESRSTGEEEGFSGRRTSSKAAGSQRADSELCPRFRTTAVAGGHTAKVPAEMRTRAATEPTGELVGGVSD